jgi:hypothetical protein
VLGGSAAESKRKPPRNESMTWMKQLSLAAAVLSIVLLSGCMVGPNYSRPDSDVNEGWIEGPDLSVQRDTDTDPAWWKVFDDPVLTRLVETAYRESILFLRSYGRSRYQPDSLRAGF